MQTPKPVHLRHLTQARDKLVLILGVVNTCVQEDEQVEAVKESRVGMDDAELLLNVTHDYKVQHLVDGMCWESVQSKYVDILALLRKELPVGRGSARR